jgi:hypothetical protein
MSAKRSLADELQSVLIAHSLDAPEPTATVEDILAKTVAASTPVTRQRRWFPSPKVIGTAAAVALLVIGVAVFNTYRSDTRTSSSSTGSAGSAVMGAPNAQSQPDSGGGKAAPRTFGSNGYGSESSWCPEPRWVGLVGSTTELPGNARHGALTVSESYCADAAGTRSGSIVTVAASTGPPARPVTVLITEPQKLHVLQLHADSTGVNIRASNPSGAVIDQRFSTTDGTVFSPGPVIPVAGPCGSADLSVSLQPTSGSLTSASRLLLFANKSARACAIEGVPGVAARVSQGADVIASPTLHEPIAAMPVGGPPVLVLEPGDSAHAFISYAVTPRSVATPCPKATDVTVSLRGNQLATLPFVNGICDFKVHPLQPGPNG